MRPTAMQEPHNKDRNKLKSQAPPTPPPKNTTMITVVCNGNRSASSSSSSLTDSGQNSYTGTKSNSDVFISSVTVGDARKKDPPPVTPREKHNRSVFMTPSPASSVKSSPAVSVKTSPSSSEKSSPAASVRSSPTLSVKSPMAVANIHSSASAPVLKPSGQTAATPLPSPKPPPPTVLPRVNSGNSTSNHGWTTVSLDAKGRPNKPDSQDVTESDFLASLPALPPDDYVASTLTSRHSKPISPTQTTQQSHQQNSSSVIATAPSSSRIVVNSSAPTKKPTPPPPPPPPKSIPRAPPLPPPSPHKPVPPAKGQRSHAPHATGKSVSAKPPAMTGISENGTSHEEDELQEDDDDDGVDDLSRERFYVNMKSGVPSDTGPGGAETTFAGRRDVTNPKSLHEKQIVSSKGTVRGFRNRVRAGIVTFVDPNSSSKQNYRESEKGKIVVYTTSVMVVRETAERCKVTRNILQTHMVRFEQRDLHMTPEHQRELRRRLETDLPLPLPQIFIDGVHLGGAEDLEKLNESGELRKILHSFPKIQVRTMCDTCGGYRYVLCGSCHGSKRSVHRNNFTEEFFALRCMHCDDNGLQRCQDCADQQE